MARNGVTHEMTRNKELRKKRMCSADSKEIGIGIIILIYNLSYSSPTCTNIPTPHIKDKCDTRRLV